MSLRSNSTVFAMVVVLAMASAAQAQRSTDRYSRNSSDRYSRNDDRSMRGSNDPSFNDQYTLLRDRNIFMRDRRAGGGPPPPRPTVTPQAAYVLTGIVKREDGGGYCAFIEDANSGTTTKIQVGSTIAQGQVSQIDFNSIQYAGTGRNVHVAIGMNLDGGIGAQLPGSLSSAEAPRTDRSYSDRRDRGGFSFGGFSSGRDRGGYGGQGGYGSGGTPATPTANTSTPPAGGITGGSLDDIEAKMRARREAQVGTQR